MTDKSSEIGKRHLLVDLSSLRDGGTLEKLREILESQFDLEILMKRREISLIEQRISQGQELLYYLIDAIRHGNSFYSGRLRSKLFESDQVALRRSSALHKSYSFSDTSREVETTFRGDDGKFYKCKCCFCGKTDFRNLLGLHNHIVSKHNTSLGGLPIVRFRCQYEVNESEIALDHPCRSAPPIEMKSIIVEDLPISTHAIAQSQPTSPPEAKMASIRIFEEDVCFEEDSHKFVERAIFEKNIVETDEIRISSMSSKTTEHADVPIQMENDMSESVQKEDDYKHVVQHFIPNENSHNSDNMFKLSSQSINERCQNEENEYDQNIQLFEKQAMSDDGYLPMAKNNIADVSSETTEDSLSRSTSISLSSSSVSAVSTVSSSRYHILHSLILGNFSYYIPEERRSHPMLLYKWKLYLRHQDPSIDMSQYIKKVRFFLHPSFAPNDIIDVLKPPFSLTRKGWGECPIRILIVFQNDLQKNLNLFHTLKLHRRKLGQWMNGSERVVQIELDKRLFERVNINDDPVKGDENKKLLVQQDEEKAEKENLENNVTLDTTFKTPIKRPLEDEEASASSSKFSVSEELIFKLGLAAMSYPITEQAALSSKRPLIRNYRLVHSSPEFLQLPFIKKYSIEWLRARKMKKFIVNELKCDTILTTRDILHWSRENGYTPDTVSESVRDESVSSLLPTIMACKYCGILNDVLKVIEDIERKKFKKESDILSKKMKKNLTEGQEAEEGDDDKDEISESVLVKDTHTANMSEVIDSSIVLQEKDNQFSDLQNKRFHEHDHYAQLALINDELESTCLLKKHLKRLRGGKRKPRRCATLTPVDIAYQQLAQTMDNEIKSSMDADSDEEMIDVEITSLEKKRERSAQWMEIEQLLGLKMTYSEKIGNRETSETQGILSRPIHREQLQYVLQALSDIRISLGLDDMKTVDEGIVAGNLIVEAMRVFLKRLTLNSIKVATSVGKTHSSCIQSAENESLPERLLTPYHVFLVISSLPETDFLTSEYFGQKIEKGDKEDENYKTVDKNELI